MPTPLPVSSPVGTFMQSDDQAEMRTALGQGQQEINSQPDSYTLVLSDAGKLVILLDSKILTIPTNASVAFPIGTWIDVAVGGASATADVVAIEGAVGVNFYNSFSGASQLSLTGQQCVRLHKRDTNTWFAMGTPTIFGAMSGILKSNGTGNMVVATSGSDYAPQTGGETAILKGNGLGGFSNAVAGTDFASPTSGSAILKGNGAGGFADAVAGTDYISPTAVNGTFSSPTSITVVNGVITAIS